MQMVSILGKKSYLPLQTWEAHLLEELQELF